MIKEAYCSFEVSKLLKEKGFDAQCRAAYTDYGQLFTTQIQQYITNIICSKGNLWKCIAPTHQMAMKWLREAHNKHCDIGYDIDLNWFFQIIDLKETVEYDYPETKYYHTENETGFNSYEEAVEAALKYCLENLI